MCEEVPSPRCTMQVTDAQDLSSTFHQREGASVNVKNAQARPSKLFDRGDRDQKHRTVMATAAVAGLCDVEIQLRNGRLALRQTVMFCLISADTRCTADLSETSRGETWVRQRVKIGHIAFNHRQTFLNGPPPVKPRGAQQSLRLRQKSSETGAGIDMRGRGISSKRGVSWIWPDLLDRPGWRVRRAPLQMPGNESSGSFRHFLLHTSRSLRHAISHQSLRHRPDMSRCRLSPGR